MCSPFKAVVRMVHLDGESNRSPDYAKLNQGYKPEGNEIQNKTQSEVDGQIPDCLETLVFSPKKESLMNGGAFSSSVL